MLSQLKDLALNVAKYTKTGGDPVAIADEVKPKTKKEMIQMNHMASKKFAMTMVAIGIIAFMYFASVIFLFFFPADPHVSALVSMYKDMIVAVASVAASLVGIQGLVDWKHNRISAVSNISETITENVHKEEYLSGPKEDDYVVDISVGKGRK